MRCAIYTRVSTDQGLEQDFNSLDAQREASEAYIKSQAHEGWRLVRDRYDDGGFSGGSMDRPALQKLLFDVQARRIDVIVVYKVDRLPRSLADFAKLVETFDAHGVSFVSVTQSFNTTTSMGRLTLNVLLSFAQFEREVTGERIRDKIAASKKKGMWMEGVVPLGYRVEDRALHIVDYHAAIVRSLFRRYLEAGSVVCLKQEKGPIANSIARRLSGIDTSADVDAILEYFAKAPSELIDAAARQGGGRADRTEGLPGGKELVERPDRRARALCDLGHGSRRSGLTIRRTRFPDCRRRFPASAGEARKVLALYVERVVSN